MHTRILVPVFAVLAFVMCQIGAAQPEPAPAVPEFPVAQKDAGGKDQPPDKKKTPDKKLPDPETDLFTRAPTMGSEFPTGFNPHMLGDFGSFFARQTITVTGTQTTTQKVTVFRGNANGTKTGKTTTVTTTTPVTQTRTILVPIAPSAGAFKIAENASPRPVDRVFGTWNYFGSIHGPSLEPTSSTTSASQTTGGGAIATDTSVATAFPGLRPTANLHRQVFGFEKTFLDGNASVELRVPFNQFSSNLDGFGGQNVGDLTIIGKYAFLLDNTTGNVFSGGLAVTAPTGPDIETSDGTIHSTLIQPWFGYIVNSQRFFVHAFHSVVVPTDARDVTLLFNDVGINFWLYRGSPDRMLNFVVPMVEAHVTTPLNHRSADGPIFFPDLVVMTGGVHLGLARNATLSLGVATPVTGPRVYDIEAFMQLNWRY